MDLERFLKTIPDEYYAWGTMCAYPKEPRRYIEVTETIEGMSTPSTMHLLNHAVACLAPGEAYLEAGTWRGMTLIGALMGNSAPGYAIDNDTMDEHDKDERPSREVWHENIERYGMEDQATYIDGDVPEVFEGLKAPPIGVYLFDGDKATTEAAYNGLMAVTPLLAKHALIVVDDANTVQIREAVFWFCHRHRDKATKLIDLPTPANCWPCFWNGVLLIAWGVGIVNEEAWYQERGDG